MRQRDERLADQQKHRVKPHAVFDKTQAKQERDNPKRKLFAPEEFYYDEETGVSFCPPGHFLVSKGSDSPSNNGYVGHRFEGAKRMCGPCELREQYLRHPKKAATRQAIDSPRGRALYGKRMGTVEPVLANLRHNIEKIANNRV
jgi:hypothetical protein